MLTLENVTELIVVLTSSPKNFVKTLRMTLMAFRGLELALVKMRISITLVVYTCNLIDHFFNEHIWKETSNNHLEVGI